MREKRGALTQANYHAVLKDSSRGVGCVIHTGSRVFGGVGGGDPGQDLFRPEIEGSFAEGYPRSQSWTKGTNQRPSLLARLKPFDLSSAMLAFPVVKKVAMAGHGLHQQIPFNGCHRPIMTKVLAYAGTRRHMVGDDRTYAVVNFQDFSHLCRLSGGDLVGGSLGRWQTGM